MRKNPLAAMMSMAFALATATGTVHAATDIEVWHSMQGVSAETFTQIVDRFNSEHKDVHVTLQYKGDPKETVDEAIAAWRAKNPPDLVQVQDEVSSGLLEIKGAVKPIYSILAMDKAADFHFFIPGSVTFMKDVHGRLEGFPLKASAPVFLYNRDAYQKAGLNPDQPPRTWKDLQGQLVALQDGGRGFACPYTTSEQSWIHIENLAQWHGETIASKNNGLDGPGATLHFNDLLHVRHIALLESWVKSDLFKYSGHEREGDAKFAAGQCATVTTGSDAIGDILQKAKFSVGVAPLPYYEEGARQPVNTLINGSGLYAMEGKKPATYKAIAEFLAYFSTPVVAAEWSQKTGSMPLTTAAFAASETSNGYSRVPGFSAVMKDITGSIGAVTRGIRLPHFDRIRDVADHELEKVWDGTKAAKQALDDAVSEGDQLLRTGH